MNALTSDLTAALNSADPVEFEVYYAPAPRPDLARVIAARAPAPALHSAALAALEAMYGYYSPA